MKTLSGFLDFVKYQERVRKWC